MPIHPRLFVLLACLLPVPRSLAAEVEPVLDAMVHTSTGTSGAHISLKVGLNFDAGDGVALMKWDEQDPGFGGSLTTAVGTFKAINGDGSFTLHQMLTDWDESTPFGTTLPVAGVDYVAHPLGTVGFNDTDRADSCDLVGVVRQWRSNPPANHGLIAVPRGQTNAGYPGTFNPEIQLAARERHPGTLDADDLRVTTTTGVPSQLHNVFEAIDDAIVRSDAPNETSRDSGTLSCGVTGPGSSSHALYRFGLGGLLAGLPNGSITFNKAHFLLVTIVADDPAVTYDVHRMLVDWDEATVTWNRFGAGGPQPGTHYKASAIGSFTLGSGARSGSVDVLAEVQSWFGTPAANYGLIIIPRAGSSSSHPLVSSERVAGSLDPDDSRLVVDVSVDLSVGFTHIVRGEVTGLSFVSEADITYRLEYERPSAPGMWTDTGIEVTGNGSTLTVFDPHGYSAQKTYRLAVVSTSQPGPGPTFSDRTADYFTSLSGTTAGFADFDQDGWVDLCDGTQVWRNHGGEFFTVFATIPGRTWGDMNNDGFPDLFSDPDAAVYRNVGGGGFAYVPLPGLPMLASRGSCWGDWNLDGLDDLYVSGYEFPTLSSPQPDARFHSARGTTMTLSWTQHTRRNGRGVTACDFDRDGDTDIYVSNYRLLPNLLWRNDNGVLTEVADAYGADGDAPELTFYNNAHTIGSAWGDFDNDGLFDLFVGNFAHESGFAGINERQPESEFLRNKGSAQSYHFEDMGTGGIIYQEGNASPTAGDWDNDGDLDLFFTAFNGPSRLYRNDGNFTFVDVTADEGLGSLRGDYQGAWADIDNDGDLDLVADGKLMINKGNAHHWLRVRLAGNGVATSRMAVGGQVKITLPGLTAVRQVEAGTGENNQNDPTLHFGLGTHAAPVDLEILWPGGATQLVQDVPVDQTITVAGP